MKGSRPGVVPHPLVKGQAMVEYLVGLAVLTAIVSIPFDGHASVAEYFMASVKEAYYGFFNAISIPL